SSQRMLTRNGQEHVRLHYSRRARDPPYEPEGLDGFHRMKNKESVEKAIREQSHQSRARQAILDARMGTPVTPTPPPRALAGSRPSQGSEPKKFEPIFSIPLHTGNTPPSTPEPSRMQGHRR